MTEQTVEMEIPTETCTYDIQKMLIYIITSFVSGFFFMGRFGSYANFSLFVNVVSFCFSMQT